jgi:fused signal recognition particle receptor
VFTITIYILLVLRKNKNKALKHSGNLVLKEDEQSISKNTDLLFEDENVRKGVSDNGTACKKGKEYDDSLDQIHQKEIIVEEDISKYEKEKYENKIKRLKQGLSPTRGGMISRLSEIFKTRKVLSPEILEELEEVLLTSDVGTKTAGKLIETIQNALERKELSDSEAVWNLLREAVRQILTIKCNEWKLSTDKPYVIMVVGVNGVGKTTTIGKLATKFSEQGSKVILAAADTFRAAAVNQLTIWGKRADAEVVKSKEGADPSSVVYEAIKKAGECKADVVIADTAGRLHTHQPLMEELKKICRVMQKAKDTAPHEVLLVLDATTGQNAIQQVAMFKETLKITGIVLTKLDGTAKGGIIIGICHEHGIPVRFIGIGESKEDLREFNIDEFVDVLFSKDDDSI